MPARPRTGSPTAMTRTTGTGVGTAAEPYGVKLWQLGNESSYGKSGFGKEEAIAHTVAFARAMRGRDPFDPADRLG